MLMPVVVGGVRRPPLGLWACTETNSQVLPPSPDLRSGLNQVTLRFCRWTKTTP